MRRLNQFCQLTRQRKLMLVEAALLLPPAWLLVKAIPFRWWSGWLGASMSGESNLAGIAFDERSQDVAWSVQAINRRVGGRITCLMLALAAQWMLNRRHISSSLVLGTLTERGDNDQLVMKAHAWLKVGPQVVLGGHGCRYTAISSFVRTYQ